MNSSDVILSGALGIRAALCFLPVLFFLFSLFLLDSFRLVRPRRVALSIGAGFLAAGVSYLANTVLMEMTSMTNLRFAILVAPVVEEALKGIFIGWLVATRRTGFLIDTAILGFATGTGFALVENFYYLHNIAFAPLLVWIIRGFGTAIMHGGTTALFGIILRGFGERRGAGSGYPWLAGLGVAVVVHAAFNRFMVHPIMATVVLLVVLPVILGIVYRLSDRNLRNWLGRGFDRDAELLALINSGEVRTTPLGRYLQSLKETFRPEIVSDMLCLLRLQAELSLRAKGTLILREEGMEPVPDPELSGKMEEVRWLEHSIGRTGLLALRPLCRWRGTNAWQRHLVDEQARRGT